MLSALELCVNVGPRLIGFITDITTLRLGLSLGSWRPPPFPNLQIRLTKVQQLRLDLVDEEILGDNPLIAGAVTQLDFPRLALLADSICDVLPPSSDGLVDNVCDEIVDDRLTHGVLAWIGLNVRADVEADARVECDDCWVALRDELVLREALDVENEEGREGVHQAVTFALGKMFLGAAAVVL